MYNGVGLETTSFDISEDIIILITYRVKVRLQGLVIAVIVSRNRTELFYTFDTDEASEASRRPIHKPGLYQSQYRIPKMFLKAGNYSVRINTGLPRRLIQSLEPALCFVVEELSINTYMKGYRKERPGHVISPGSWKTEQLE